MVVNGQLEAPSADDLLGRLDEPRVVAALNDLLDHADLLAMLVVGLNGMLSRGEVIGDSVVAAIGELRGASGKPAGSLSSLDLEGLAGSLVTLSSSMVKATPALNSLLSSQLTAPQAVEVISQLASALVHAREQIDRQPDVPTGVFGLVRALKDPDVARGLGYMVEVARSFGKQIASA